MPSVLAADQSLKKAIHLFRTLRVSKWRITSLITVGLALMLCNVFGEVKMNAWQGLFFSAVEHRNASLIVSRCTQFVVLVSILLCFVVTYYYVIDYLKMNFRMAMARTFTNRWLTPKCSYRLTLQESGSLCPDQRIQEDIRQFTDLTIDLGSDLTKSIVLIFSFLIVLWNLSADTKLFLFGQSLVIPGFMVWFAIAYAAGGTLLAVKAGKTLIVKNDEKYTREAEYRKSLARVDEHSESIAFHSGESFESAVIDEKLNNVVATLKILARAKAKLSYVAWGHGWMVTLMSVAIAAPGYLQHKFDFGGIMVVVGAFGQVQSSMRWFVANYSNIADWRCLVNRLYSFDLILAENSSVPESNWRLRSSVAAISAKNLVVKLLSGKRLVDGFSFKLLKGDRVLLTGDSGCGKSSILRALSGIWPWIEGTVQFPQNGGVAFLPQKPYFPVGALAAAITYPMPASTFSTAEINNALESVNLGELKSRVSEVSDWSKTLSLGQQQRIAFARLLLMKPMWVFMDEATSALDEENENLVMSLFSNELLNSTLMSVGHRSSLKKHHSRNIVVRKQSMTEERNLEGTGQATQMGKLLAMPNVILPVV